MRCAAIAAILLTTVPAHAGAQAPGREPTTRRAPPKPATHPPDVRLSIEAPSTRGPWTVRVTNESDASVQIVADARLLGLDVTPRGAKAPVRCELPSDMRPTDDLERDLVLPPKRSYSERFEPRLYCFSGKAAGALAPGAIVVAHLGWTNGPKAKSPFEVSPPDHADPILAPAKAIDAPPIAVPDETTSFSAAPPSAPADREAYAPRLSMSAPGEIDAQSPNDIEVPLTLHNSSARSVVVRFRPETIAFDVTGPGGRERCNWPVMPAAPMAELFTTLAPNGYETLSVLLSAYCRGVALDQPGLIVVRPRLDTRNAGGAAIGTTAFEGEVLATTPTLVRLHRGALPLPFRHPRLEPAGVSSR